jgi:hypothetical protein
VPQAPHRERELRRARRQAQLQSVPHRAQPQSVQRRAQRRSAQHREHRHLDRQGHAGHPVHRDVHPVRRAQESFPPREELAPLKETQQGPAPPLEQWCSELLAQPPERPWAPDVLQALLEPAQASVPARLVPRTAQDGRRPEACRARDALAPGVPGERAEASVPEVRRSAPAQPEASAVPRERRLAVQADAAAELLPEAGAAVSGAEGLPLAAGAVQQGAAGVQPREVAAAARQDAQRGAVAVGPQQAVPGAAAQQPAADPSAVPWVRPSNHPAPLALLAR